MAITFSARHVFRTNKHAYVHIYSTICRFSLLCCILRFVDSGVECRYLITHIDALAHAKFVLNLCRVKEKLTLPYDGDLWRQQQMHHDQLSLAYCIHNRPHAQCCYSDDDPFRFGYVFECRSFGRVLIIRIYVAAVTVARYTFIQPNTNIKYDGANRCASNGISDYL